jgi:hypothetical protein
MSCGTRGAYSKPAPLKSHVTPAMNRNFLFGGERRELSRLPNTVMTTSVPGRGRNGKILIAHHHQTSEDDFLRDIHACLNIPPVKKLRTTQEELEWLYCCGAPTLSEALMRYGSFSGREGGEPCRSSERFADKELVALHPEPHDFSASRADTCASPSQSASFLPRHTQPHLPGAYSASTSLCPLLQRRGRRSASMTRRIRRTCSVDG